MDHEPMDMAINQMLERTACSGCGGRLRLHHVLTRQPLVALIETRCCSCDRTAKTLCFDGTALRTMRREFEDGVFGGSCESHVVSPDCPSVPVTADDVGSVSDFLDSFDGNFARLFGRH